MSLGPGLGGGGNGGSPSGGGSGDVTKAGNNAFTGANSFTTEPRTIPVDLAGGTALTVGTSYYDSLSAIRTLTFTGGPSAGDKIRLLLIVTNAPTLTIPSCKRVGQADSAITTLAMTNGIHVLSWEYENSTWWLCDSVFSSVDLASQVTGVLPVANGGTASSSGSLAACTADGTNAVGYLTVPSNSQSAAYTAVLADSGKAIDHPSTDANARTFTIPANASVAYPIGTCLSFSNMTSQVVTIAITTDTLYLAGTGSTGSRSLAQYGVATARKLTSTTWLISGVGLT